jgi:hypothetical protein
VVNIELQTVAGLAYPLVNAVVLLLIAALPTQLEAAAALLLFAPMTAVSMTICTTAFAWVLTRRLVAPVYRTARSRYSASSGWCSGPGTPGWAEGTRFERRPSCP